MRSNEFSTELDHKHKNPNTDEMLLMLCGHVVQSKDQNNNPACVICIGIDPKATIISPTKPSLEGRKAICLSCRNVRDSDWKLAFFELGATKNDLDKYYCGCRGWD